MFLHWTPAVDPSKRAYIVNSFTSQSAAETLTTQAKFGSYSANIRGAGFVRYFAVPDFDIGTEDFAIEFWYWLVEVPPVNIHFLAQSQSITQTSGGGLSYYTPSSEVWSFQQYSDGTLRVNSLGTQKNLGTITTGQWYHVAVANNSTTGLSTYLDGTRITNSTYAGTSFTDRSIWFTGFSRAVPNDSDPGFYIDGFRFTIGSDAGYSGTSFTPPSTMPPEVSGETRLRLNFEGTFADIP